MAFCKTFTYNGRSLTDVYDDLMVVDFDFSGGSESQILARTVNRSPLTYDESIAYDYGAVDNEVFTFTLTIARKDASHMTQNRVRNLVSWLMSPTEPQWLSMEICEDAVGRTVVAGVLYGPDALSAVLVALFGAEVVVDVLLEAVVAVVFRVGIFDDLLQIVLVD